MRNITGLVLLLTLFSTGCSSEGLKRSAYSTLQNMEKGRCQANSAEPCVQQEGYDDYQQRRKELEQNP